MSQWLPYQEIGSGKLGELLETLYRQSAAKLAGDSKKVQRLGHGV